MTPETSSTVLSIWESYEKTGKKVKDTKGNEFADIDRSRLRAIEDIKVIIQHFTSGKISIYEFKTTLDSYNKQNNYWGFTAAKGQMFFNLLVRSSEDNIDSFAEMLKELISIPISLKSALEKIQKLSNYASSFLANASDKRKVANPKSAAYFLSYFWQIYDPNTWPIMYSSMITAFEKIELWNDTGNAADNYKQFHGYNEEAKNIISTHIKRRISNWDLEHALWAFAETISVNSKTTKVKGAIRNQQSEDLNLLSEPDPPYLDAGFDLNDYLIPKVAKLIELGASTEKKGAQKGSEFEKMVAETFKLLDFEVDLLGQGTGRFADAIIKIPEEHIAFIVDAKAYSNGYILGTDDRAIKDYINRHCPQLKSKGFNKIGFIIVSNSFKSDLTELINEITWNTDIKRFLLITTEALLYLLAFKTKDKLPLIQIVETLISLNSTITKEKIIQEFADV